MVRDSAGFKPMRVACLLATLPLLFLLPRAASALTGNHEVIVAYYPIFPRWYTSDSCLWIGDPVRQYPLLGLYDNKTDANVNVFDFKAMAYAGVTVVNPHVFDTHLDESRLDRIDASAGAAGIRWTPTFEAFTSDPAGMADITNELLSAYGSSPNFMKVNGRHVMFWAFMAESESSIAAAIETVRAVSGPVMIIIENVCAGYPCQFCCNGNTPISPWFSGPDGSTGYSRASGFYAWVSVYWCIMPRTQRRTHVNNFVNNCVNGNMVPVLGTSPSGNEESWGYECDDGIPPAENCGVGGQRCDIPSYNTDRSLTEWEENLNDLLYNNHDDAWIYVQAYDEWAEGSAIGPDTYNCYGFVAKLREVLQEKLWLCGVSSYCRPELPPGYSPTHCLDTPICGQGIEIATYEGETGFSHSCGSAIAGGWRVTTSNSNCWMAYGPYTPSLPAGKLTARFWLRIDDNAANDNNICRIDVWDATAESQLAVLNLSRRVWCQAAVYEPFDLAFTSPGGGHLLEFRTYYFGGAQLDLDRIDILSPDLPAKATNPDPTHGVDGVSLTKDLSWTAGTGARSRDVYFGTDTSPPYRGNQTATTYEPGRLAPHKTYYWRIDERNETGATTGDTWSFTTQIVGDHDGDNDVDQEDFGHFQACLSGSDNPHPPGCEDVDMDGDGAVDQTDLSVFLECVGGADNPPGC